MQIFSVVWGKYHLELFEKGLLKSFQLKLNRQALFRERGIWNIWTDEVENVQKLVSGLFPELKINVISLDNLRRYTDPIQNALVIQIEKCLEQKQKMLMAPPDTIFGNGSIGNILKVGYQKDACVVVPHPRVLPTILNETLSDDTSNADLVSLAWKHLHGSWVNAEKDHPQQSSFVGGVTWQYLDDKTMSVTHLLPTVYLADFNESDLEFFKHANSFGDWDHTWAIKTLQENRQRFLASSDAAFICEITEVEKNIPPWHHEHPKDGSFWRDFPHNKINKGIVATFRRN